MDRFPFLLGHLGGDLAAYGADLALQIAYASLAGVVADDESHCLVIDRNLLRAQRVLPDLAREKVLLGDAYFLFLGVAI